ncbi:hypothetical protein BDV33DRAFT_204836 [Aspergillus novoparasiticus]|uniref:Zn(2)-C6 fungal-type domain-containing protein n=1 Tax=Aspergillus novoparasiticus TaxID=986946 RepID=A0A5N6EMV7_9EURO|nr:hypothetical protein BDV33DRAFT_204836 [Aspergillus novoparasiticus]
MEAPDSDASASQTKIRWKRTRSGCLKCRSRRRKCDGARPQCRNCQARGTTCRWGLKASFHRSRNLSLSHKDVATLCAIERRRDSLPSQARAVPTIIDESESIIRDYHFPNDAYTSDSVLDQSHEAERSGVDEDEIEGVFHGDKSVVDDATALTALERSGCGSKSSPSALDTSHLHPQESSTSRTSGTNDGLSTGQSSIRHLLCQPNTQTSESFHPVFLEYTFSPLSDVYHYRPHGIATHEAGTYIPPFSLGLAVSQDESPLPEPFLPVTCTEKARLISSFMQETGTWCETTDSNMHFTMRSLHLMMKSTAFVAAAMSLASRQLDHVEKVQRPVTLELYQYTIQHLLRQDPAKADASVLATCTLLCVYEMMASDVHEWRRHLKGCAGLLLAKKWNGSSQGIVKSCFWAFARIDVWAAFISGKTTLIPTDFWLDDISIESLATKRDVDDFCNLAIFIFAQIVNMLAAPGFGTKKAGSTLAVSVSRLWGELQKWYRLRPQEVCPLLKDSCLPPRVFPAVIYTSASAICGNTFYHTGSMLLLQTGLIPESEISSSPVKDAVDLVWHARELCGISMSNSSHANWVNQLQPLYIAGAVFANKSSDDQVRFSPSSISRIIRQSIPSHYARSNLEEEYATEKILLLKHLARIENETGWKTLDRAADLRKLWGF